MNVPAAQHKVALLCEHLENLCQQSVRLMEAGESTALTTLQERKALILDELRQGVQRFTEAVDAAFRDGIAHRVRIALSGELRGINALLLNVKQQLHQQAMGELRLAKVRRGYGASANPEERAYDVSLSARG